MRPLEIQRLFYVLLFFVHVQTARFLFRFFDLSHVPQALGFFKIFSGLLDSSWLAAGLLIVNFFILGLVIWKPQIFAFRFFSFLSAVLIASLEFSLAGTVTNDPFAWVFASFFMCFSPSVLVFRLCQATLFAHYFLSGMWKVRGLIKLGAWVEAPLNALAMTIGEGMGPREPILPMLQANTWILVVGWYLVILFQCTCFVPVVWPRWVRVWGVGAILFHLCTGVFLNIWFAQTTLAVLFFLVLYPGWERESQAVEN